MPRRWRLRLGESFFALALRLSVFASFARVVGSRKVAKFAKQSLHSIKLRRIVMQNHVREFHRSCPIDLAVVHHPR